MSMSLSDTEMKSDSFELGILDELQDLDDIPPPPPLIRQTAEPCEWAIKGGYVPYTSSYATCPMVTCQPDIVDINLSHYTLNRRISSQCNRLRVQKDESHMHREPNSIPPTCIADSTHGSQTFTRNIAPSRSYSR